MYANVFIAKFFMEEFQELGRYKAVHKLLFKFRHDNTSVIWCHGLETLRDFFYHEMSVGIANFSCTSEASSTDCKTWFSPGPLAA